MSILKLTVWPWLTLMSVAKPWIAASPAPFDVPLARGIAGLLVLANDRVAVRRIARSGRLRAGPVEEDAGTSRAADGNAERDAQPNQGATKGETLSVLTHSQQPI